jgi:cyanate permease
VPPVLETIHQDLGLGRAYLGLLTTIPILCMSIFALVAPKISGRIGAERAVLWSVVLVGAAVVARLTTGQPGGTLLYPSGKNKNIRCLLRPSHLQLATTIFLQQGAEG